MLLGLQIGGLCDASDQVNLAQQRYPAGDASCDADCTADAALDDLAYDCSVIVVNDPFFGPWNNGSTYFDGCRKGNLLVDALNGIWHYSLELDQEGEAGTARAERLHTLAQLIREKVVEVKRATRLE